MPVLSTLGAAIANVYGFTSGLIKDQYFNLVSLLLPGNGTNGAQNNTFLDSSSNTFTITRNGNTTQGTFSPFSQTGWGASFTSSSSQYLTVGSASDWTFLHNGSTNWTISAWFWWTGSNGTLVSTSATSSNPGIHVFIEASGNFGVRIYNGSTALEASVATPAGAPSTNTWNYFTATLNASTKTLTVYLNGSQIATTTNAGFSFSASAPSYTLAIGRYQFSTPGYYFNGYMSGVSINKSIDSASVPLTPLTSTNGLLICQYNRFRDASTNGFAVTANGSVAITPFSPFAPTQFYSAAAVGGSGYFDGTGDYLSASGNPTLTTNFTIEFWFYMPSWGDRVFLSQGGGGANFSASNGVAFQIYSTSTTFYVQWANGSGGFGEVSTATSGIALNAWHHVAIGNNGTTTRVWIDGTSVGTNTGTPTWNYPTTRSTYIGYVSYTSTYVSLGYMAGVRMVTSDVYGANNASITVPTAPLTAITNTQLLLNFTNAGVVDATAKNVLETVGNAQISTTQSKWGGGSILFDGTGDYLQLPASNIYAFGTGDFTIECWVRFSSTTVSSGQGICQFDTAYLNSTTNGPAFGTNHPSGKWAMYVGATSYEASTLIPAINTWYHVALVRYSGTTKLYVDGTAVTGLSQADTNNYTRQYLTVGGWYSTSYLLNGYIDDFRVSRFARYTANFTAPTAPFPVQ